MTRNIALIICIVALIFILDNFKFEINKENKNLIGEKISDYLYKYDYVDNEEAVDYLVKDDYIYFLTYKENKYDLYKRNIYDNKILKINSYISADEYCSFTDLYITCDNIKQSKLFDLDFNKKYVIETKNNLKKIIPYKDTYLILDENKLYIEQNNEYILFKTLDNITIDNFIEYYVTSKNTYILFYQDKQDMYYVFDVNSNTFTEEKISNYSKYASGYYFYNEEKIIIYNLEDSSVLNYNNEFINVDNLYTINNDGNIFYSYDIDTQKLIVLNIEEDEIININLGINIDLLIVKNNYMYLFSNNNFYLIDLNEIENNSIKLAEYQETESKSLENNIIKLETDYNITLNIKAEAAIDFPDFYVQKEEDNLKIVNAINKIENILKKFNYEFFSNFSNNDYKGLNIYLTSTLTPSNYETQIATPAAYSLVYNQEYMIVIDINQNNIEEILCHEIMHNLEFQMQNNNYVIFEDWENYNPKDFIYNNSYTKEYIYDYTLEELEIDNVYFIDKYSHTYSLEDRARIFEKICACEEDSIVNNYPNLYLKGKYLKEEILKHYSLLKNTSVFNSLN